MIWGGGSQPLPQYLLGFWGSHSALGYCTMKKSVMFKLVFEPLIVETNPCKMDQDAPEGEAPGKLATLELMNQPKRDPPLRFGFMC